jgi:hypothetical protein
MSNAPEYLAASGYAGGHLYRDEPAVTDRRVITAGGTQPVDFAAHVFAALDLCEPHALSAWHGCLPGRPAMRLRGRVCDLGAGG